jgi:hypothetical protein
MTGHCEQDTNSVDDIVSPDWDESSDESADDLPELVEDSFNDSADDLPELVDPDMPELLEVPVPNFEELVQERRSRAPPPEDVAAASVVRLLRPIPVWAISHSDYPAWFNARYPRVGHTHMEIDALFRDCRPQGVPFPSLQTDNAPGEFKSNLRSLM